jgi:pimeloyl-ACP methyl ester carboxylesterase
MKARSERFTTPALQGVELHALHWGDDALPPLVLLHGGGANAHWWDHVAPRLAQRFHVVALDFRGHGDSDHPQTVVAGAFDQDLEAMLVHLDAGPVTLLGHSMGGGIALSYVAREVAREAAREPRIPVCALIAVDVAAGASPVARRGARLALALRRTYATREEAIARYRFLPPSRHAREELREAIAAHSVERQPDGRYGFKFDPRWFSIPGRTRPALTAVSCPTLILRGSESTLLTAEGARKLVAELPDARCVEIEGAGHHVPLDRPREFLAAVENFLDQLPRTSSAAGPG